MNQSQTVDLTVKLCLLLADKEETVKRIPTAQTFKDLQAQCEQMLKNANIPTSMKTVFNYRDSDGDKIVVSDDYELQMAYATALSADCKVKFYIEVPEYVAPQPKKEEPVVVEEKKPVVEEKKPVEPTVVEEPKVEAQPVVEPVEIQANLEEADDSSDEHPHHQFHGKGKKGKKGKGKKGKGKCGGGANMPRRAVKNLIRNELETVVPGLFDKLLQEQETNESSIPQPEEESKDQSKDQSKVVHEGIECDGCGVCPILGVRYKCSVRKDFDYCEKCEESLNHEYPMLKIRKAGGAPSMILTVLNEDAEGKPVEGQPDWKEMREQFKQIREHFKAQKPQNRCNKEWTEEECQQKAEFWKKMVGGFLGKMGMDKADWGQMKQNWGQMKEEWRKNCGKQEWDKQDWGQMKENWKQMKQDWKQQHGHEHRGGFGGHRGGCGGHRVRRAMLQKQITEVLECQPGCVVLQEIEVQNKTNWPWKEGCFLSLSSDVDQTNMPIELINVPVDQKVEADQILKITVPVCVLESAETNVFDFSLKFRGPKGGEFGEAIPLKLRVVAPQTQKEQEVPQVVEPEPVKKSHLELVKLAVKLFDEEKLGQTFNECLEIVTAVNGDDNVARKCLQPRQ